MKKRIRLTSVRRSIQIFFFILILFISVGHSLSESGISLPLIEGASLHAVCPFGGVVSIYQYLTAGTFTQKIHDSSFILMILVFLTAILFGPVFCGWICPFGSIQEWIGKIGRKIFKRKYNNFVPGKIDRILRYLRYAVLAWVIIMTAVSTKLIFSDYDPYYALFNFWTGEVAITGFAALGAVIVLSLFVERPFCKYACPYGAVLGITNFFRVFKIRRNESTCISCSACDKECSMNIKVSKTKNVMDHQCIACYACTSDDSCPIPETVLISTTRLQGKTKAVKEAGNEN
ncbi:MAG: 4Fe-4S binding protein [Spirochaetia bacterium]|nr:4Fe-4S binding protein [Spirochaetia bacterium]